MTLDRYLVRQFIPIFLIIAFLFMMSVVLLDLFANLWRYITYEVPVTEILSVSLYYLPKSFSYALPVALLFAAAYTLAGMYGRNELTSIFASGVPFLRFTASLLLIGATASVFAFRFDDHVVIPTLKIKNELSRRLLRQSMIEENNSDIVIKSRGGDLVYAVDYYDYNSMVLNGVSIIEVGGDRFSHIRARSGTWNGEYWELSDAVAYRWKDGFIRADVFPPESGDIDETAYRESPETFRRGAVKPEELSAKEAALLVEDLKSAGLPYIEAEADYHHRYSFSFTPFVVMILSISMGCRFRKNILLMTLLSSVGVAVVFYVMDMISMMMAKLGYIPPAAGAWFPVIFFIFAGFLLLRTART